MSNVSASVWMISLYSLFLVCIAHACDLSARHVARRAQAWRTGSFRYHADHDAWVCPEDQWLWPVSFDVHQRTMRYRANPVVCNRCPVKDTCTTSSRGREIEREVDPWPHSEAGRFHRGIACSMTLLAFVLPLAMLPSRSEPVDAVTLLGVMTLVVLASLPLFSHFRNTPAGFPTQVPLEDTAERGAALERTTVPTDRFATRWNDFEHKWKAAP